MAGVIVLLLGSILAAPARGGTYVMRNCDVPGHASALLGPWGTAEMQPNARLVDACATGAGVGFTFSGAHQMAPGGWATLRLLKPANGPQSQLQFVKASLWYAARLGGTGQQINLTSLDIHSDSTFRLGVTNGPPGAENLALEQLFSPTETNTYKVGVVCGPVDHAGTGEACVAADAMPFQVRGMEVTLSEDVPPIVLQPGGALLGSGPQSGLRDITYSASDPQSGLAKVEVLLDDTVVASRDLTPRCPFTDFTVCPASLDDTLQVDTRAVPNGSRRLALRVRDAAGNERVVIAGGVVDVANEAVSGASTTSANSLTAQFNGSSRSTLTVPYGRRVSLRGRLAGGSQAGFAGAEIEVLETLKRRDPREVTVGRVQAGADGAFSYIVRANGPSRTLRLAFRPGGGSAVVSRALRLQVRAASSLRASLRGVDMRFRGRVRSGPIPRSGATVRMEGRAPGSAWKSFATLRTDRKGRFSGSYRLRVRRPGVKLKIRAMVPATRGYPYATGRSRVLMLRVR